MTHRGLCKTVGSHNLTKKLRNISTKEHRSTHQKKWLNGVLLSGRRDSNPRPPAPKAGALTGLRYAPIQNVFASQKRCVSPKAVQK